MTAGPRRTWRPWAGLLAAGLCLAGCSPQTPIRIGFLGGLMDRNASMSEDARNGVLLAIEQRNRAGGVAGRRLELVVRDHGAGLDRASEAVRLLLDARVDAVIGPYTSDVVVHVLPLLDRARVLMLSPTAPAASLAGRHDHLVRLNHSTGDNARDLAGRLYERGQRRLALAIDRRDSVYCASLRDDLRHAFAALGGAVVAEAEFGLRADDSFDALVRTLLTGGPDGIVAITASVDAALIAQQVVKHAGWMPMAAVAASDALIELGGRAVEGMLVAQAFNRADTSPRYLAFRQAYLARFDREPGYAAVMSYDAVTVVAEAMARSAPDESLRDAVLRHQPYPGLQDPIRFDRFGDGSRTAYFSVVRNGRFEPL